LWWKRTETPGVRDEKGTVREAGREVDGMNGHQESAGAITAHLHGLRERAKDIGGGKGEKGGKGGGGMQDTSTPRSRAAYQDADTPREVG
jgi:hypothetical protein